MLPKFCCCWRDGRGIFEVIGGGIDDKIIGTEETPGGGGLSGEYGNAAVEMLKGSVPGGKVEEDWWFWEVIAKDLKKILK